MQKKTTKKEKDSFEASKKAMPGDVRSNVLRDKK